ncbi:MAG: T9SS type A sorting domain-containing protein [Bacteroidota bacterium]
MKKENMKIKSLLIAALVTITSIASFAGKDEPRKTGLAVVPVKGSESFKVIYRGETAGKVKLNIYNATGQTILSETINGVEGFICPVNFRGLASGEYTIELVDASGKKSEKINFIKKQSIRHIHVSKLTNDEAKFLLAVANSGDELINVRIYDAQNNLVHTESKQISGDFAQVYKLEAATGSYTFEISDKAGNTRTIRF